MELQRRQLSIKADGHTPVFSSPDFLSDFLVPPKIGGTEIGGTENGGGCIEDILFRFYSKSQSRISNPHPPLTIPHLLFVLNLRAVTSWCQNRTTERQALFCDGIPFRGTVSQWFFNDKMRSRDI